MIILRYILCAILVLPSFSNASIIISQYIETNSGTTPKGIELWNVSGSTIDFSSTNLVIKKGVNGATPSADYTLSSGTLINGGVIVIGTSGDLATATTDNGGTHYTEAFTYNGDDALEVHLGGTLTDMFGTSGVDPGSSWSGSGVSTANQNIKLLSGIVSGDTDGWSDPSDRFETVSSTPVSDQGGFGLPPGLLISGNAGFRMLSAPVSNGTYTDLLSELWTQGMTGSDAAEASGDNVWDWVVGSGSAGSWAVVNYLTSTMTAGAGILVYAFSDNNNDGTDDLPVALSVSGTENSGDIRYPSGSGAIIQNRYGFAGNPYYQTIDWDDVTKQNISATVYIHDHAKSGGAGYISWNGSSGDVTDGLIAPFQGFVVTASGGSGYIIIAEADKSSTAGTFYRMLDGVSEGSSYLEFTTIEGGYSKSWLSFREDGEVGQDDRDAKKLMPLMASSRLVSLTHNEENSLDINNLPYNHEGTISIPLDVMSLSVEDNNYVTSTTEVSMSWNLDDLPDHIELTLIDNITGDLTYLNQEMSHYFTTESKGSFSATYDNAVSIYPMIGESRFTLNISYSALDNHPIKVIPSEYALNPVYPNPFNPSATIQFNTPKVSRVELQVFDLKGALVETLLNKLMLSGQHSYTWQPKALPTGTYFLKLITNNQSFTQKVTYVK